MLGLGFVGSFGHCIGMCGPLSLALSAPTPRLLSWIPWVLLHLGRLGSYALMGGLIGATSSVVVAGGLAAGVGSELRQILAMATGLGMIALGARQLWPGWLPLQLPHPDVSWAQHLPSRWWRSLLLGALWGLMPCGFLYVAQLKAANASSAMQGAMLLLAFGLGTCPALLLVAGLTQLRSYRQHFSQIGGWLTVLTGGLTLVRTGAMQDLTGHGALLLLGLALVARPLAKLQPSLLTLRRLLGLGGFCLAIAHVLHMLEHWFNWRLDKLEFLPPQAQLGLGLGIIALGALMPAALTSTHSWQQRLGLGWRAIHLASVPALGLAVWHSLLLGTSYWGAWQITPLHWLRAGLLFLLLIGVLLIRGLWVWQLFKVENYYGQTSR